jgi:hypothetical protein
LLNIEIDNTPCIVVVSVDDRKKAEERLKEMNALLILKTTRSSNAAELSLCHRTCFSKRTKEKQQS